MVKDKSFYKLLVFLALPVAFQGVMSLGVNMADNIMVGSLGEISLSGVALANQLTIFITFFIKGVTGGAAVLTAQYWGKRDLASIKSVTAVSTAFCFAIIALVVTLFSLFPRFFMGAFTSDPAILDVASDFLRIVCFSYIFFLLSESLISVLRCVEVISISLWVTCISLTVNVFLNYTLIFGKFGFPALGTNGAAIATVITRIIELAIVLTFVFAIDKRLQLKITDFCKFNRVLFGDFLRFGTPIVIGDMQWGLVGTIKAVIIGHLGAQMISAFTISDLVLQLSSVFSFSLASAACIIIGKSVGEGDYAKTRRYSNTIQILFAIFGIVTSSLLYIVRALPVSFYSLSEDTFRLTVNCLAIGALSLIGTTYHAACFVGINRGAGDGKFVIKVDMICGWLVVIPSMLLTAFVLPLPLEAVFFASRIDQFYKWIIAFFRLRGNRWITNVTRNNNVEEALEHDANPVS